MHRGSLSTSFLPGCRAVGLRGFTSTNYAEVTVILSGIPNGDPTAALKLLPLVYDELRKVAAQKFVQEKYQRNFNEHPAHAVPYQRR
jgi:hypothetical protein